MKERPCRILLASPYQGSGGITRWAENVLFYYKEHCNQIKLYLLPMNRRPLHNSLERVIYGIWEYLRYILKAWKMMTLHHYDVMHLCSSGSLGLAKDIVMLSLAKHYHVKTVLHFHFGRIPSVIETSGWEWLMMRKAIKCADKVISMDKFSFEALKAIGYTNISLVPNPLSTKVIQFAKKNDTKLKRDEDMILYAGHCYDTKGVYELVYACNGIKNVRIVLVGSIEKTVERELREIVENGNSLEILGERSHEEVISLMLQCGVFVLPSYTEGFPNVILESMACGCAIVATAVGAIPEMIGADSAHICGLLIPPKDSGKLKEAIEKFMNNPELRDNCRLNAKLRVCQEYNMEIVWNQLVGVWASCLS